MQTKGVLGGGEARLAMLGGAAKIICFLFQNWFELGRKIAPFRNKIGKSRPTGRPFPILFRNGAGGENRTRITCLEGRYISHYTTPAQYTNNYITERANLPFLFSYNS